MTLRSLRGFNMKQQRFWNVDLIVVFKDWLQQMWTFLLTLLTFLALSLPVAISAFILWWYGVRQ